MSDKERLTYEAPCAMRLGDARPGQGVCRPGSGDSEACYTPGNSANLECNEPGNSATGGACNYPGNSATPDCYQPGSGPVHF